MSKKAFEIRRINHFGAFKVSEHTFLPDVSHGLPLSSLSSGSPKLEGKRVFPTQSHSIQTLNEGGIEAALVQYDVTSRKNEASLLPDTSMRLDAAAESSFVAPSLPMSLGMEPFSLDNLNEGFRPSSMRLVNPDLISHARMSYGADGFQPLDHQRKNYSFHFLGQAKIRPINDSQGKTPGEYAKESKLGPRRKSQWDTPKDFGRKVTDYSANQTTDINTTCDRLLTQVSSPQRGKQHNQKSHQQQSHRHRRQPWVLNPFRQEDEEEVLAKRTHNRRRWSHVFPLGEDEFKRHAGPNWKSLCQPAIRK